MGHEPPIRNFCWNGQMARTKKIQCLFIACIIYMYTVLMLETFAFQKVYMTCHYTEICVVWSIYLFNTIIMYHWIGIITCRFVRTAVVDTFQYLFIILIPLLTLESIKMRNVKISVTINFST